MDAELPPDVIAAVEARRKVAAIKLLREHWGIDLKEAKGVIDGYIAEDTTQSTTENTTESTTENPQLSSGRSKQEVSGFGQLLLSGIIAALFYGLYDFFVGTR